MLLPALHIIDYKKQGDHYLSNELFEYLSIEIEPGFIFKPTAPEWALKLVKLYDDPFFITLSAIHDKIYEKEGDFGYFWMTRKFADNLIINLMLMRRYKLRVVFAVWFFIRIGGFKFWKSW